MLVIIKDGELTFSYTATRSTGIGEIYTFDDLLTEHGFIIPIVQAPGVILDAIEKRAWSKDHKGFYHALISPEGGFYEVNITSGKLTRRRVLATKFYVRSSEVKFEEAIHAAYLVNPELNGIELYNAGAKATTFRYAEMETVNLKEFTAKIKEAYDVKYPKD